MCVAVCVNCEPRMRVVPTAQIKVCVNCEVQQHLISTQSSSVNTCCGCMRCQRLQIEVCVNAADPHFPTTRLVCLENSTNKGGGAIYSLQAMRSIREVSCAADTVTS
jgi:hypothetical protein